MKRTDSRSLLRPPLRPLIFGLALGLLGFGAACTPDEPSRTFEDTGGNGYDVTFPDGSDDDDNGDDEDAGDEEPEDTGVDAEDPGMDTSDGGGGEDPDGGDEEDTSEMSDGGDMDGTSEECPGSDEALCGTGSCVDLNSNGDHCGSCNNSCDPPPNASASCVGGDCQFNCQSGFEDQNGDLQDPNGDGCEAETGCTESNGGVEACDGEDNDCDGQVDEEFPSKGSSCEVGQGVCKKSGTLVCNNAEDDVVCSVEPSDPPEDPEKSCDGKDNDCDGSVDEGCDDDNDGICDESMDHTSSASCDLGPNGGGDCDDEDPDRYPGAPPACDGKDNDCDSKSDELEERKQYDHSVTVSGVEENSSWGDFTRRVAVDRAGDGFCGAFLQSDKSEIGFVRIESDGSKTTHTGSPNGNEPAELLDIAWSGSSCGVVYRRQQIGGDDVILARWNPSQSSTIEQVKLNDDTYEDNNGVYWSQFAAVEFVDSINQWVAVTVGADAGTDDPLFYHLVDENFTTQSNNPQQNKIYEDICAGDPPQPEVNVGPAPSSNHDFAIVFQGQVDPGILSSCQERMKVWSVSGASNQSTGSSQEQSGALVKNASNYGRPTIEEVPEGSGDYYLTYYDRDSTERVVQELLSSYNYDGEARASSDSFDPYPATRMLGGDTGVGFMLLEEYADETDVFDKGGSLSLDPKNHSSIGGSDHLLSHYGDDGDDSIYLLSLTGTQPYELELDAFSCY